MRVMLTAPQRWLPHREASEHEKGDTLHCKSVPQRQDLAEEDQAQQERIPDLSRCGWLIQHGGQSLQTGERVMFSGLKRSYTAEETQM